MPFTDEHKRQLEKEIVDTIVFGLERNTLQNEELAEVASFVLARIDTIQNQDQLAEFLTELSVKWPVFRNIMEIELGKVKSEKEKQVAHDVLQLANAGNIEEAIRLAKTMTEQK